ncbi:hypothetical protein VTK73DRAFT_3724 [Phialemonium thermophilum]|uniref:Uncharacterized protein n=1 Tax=Phialemonium thermophilum TaxID=223376 RepID=A0ABR3VG49_9PEZI
MEPRIPCCGRNTLAHFLRRSLYSPLPTAKPRIRGYRLPRKQPAELYIRGTVEISMELQWVGCYLHHSLIWPLTQQFTLPFLAGLPPRREEHRRLS